MKDYSSPMKKLFYQLVLISLVAVMVFSLVACASPSSSNQPAASSSAPSTGKQETLELLGGTMGSSSYVASFALGQILNKNPKLKASAVETSGATENTRTLLETPAKRANTVVQTNLFTMVQAKKGDSPFSKPYSSLKIVAGNLRTITTFATLNPKIKTMDDLKGKRIDISQKGISPYWKNFYLLKNGWGFYNEKNIETLGFAAGKDALLDGKIDVSCQAASEGLPGKWVPVPATSELINTKPTFFVSIDRNSLAKAEKETGYPLPYVELPTGSMGPNQTEPIGTIGYYMLFAADQSMSTDLVYEITKSMYQNISQFGQYDNTLKSMTEKSMYSIPGVSREDFHPGALKFYDEIGIKIGS